jgi:predicted XRE-type DNA-binding protein
MKSEPSAAGAREEFAKMMAALIDGSDKSQIEIARALGYANPNIITMFKKGTTRIPADKVATFAAAIGENPSTMLRRWFEAYMPAVLPDIDAYL